MLKNEEIIEFVEEELNCKGFCFIRKIGEKISLSFTVEKNGDIELLLNQQKIQEIAQTLNKICDYK
ncbi:hypothetical protein KJ671_03680 [Patescibacteria group bacterium]|nr:hypothetical protein [Patescibacteria group bacterium]